MRGLQGARKQKQVQGATETPGALKEPILLDSTFDYWSNAVVPPRMQAMVPQARFVVILQVWLSCVYLVALSGCLTHCFSL